MAGIVRTRAQLEAMVYAEIRKDTAVIPATDVYDALNESGAIVLSLLEEYPDQRYNYATATQNVNPGVDFYTPSSYRRMISLRYNHDDGSKPEIFPGGPELLGRVLANDSRTWADGSDVHYLHLHNKLVFDPNPEKQYALDIHYIPNSVFRASGGAVIQLMTASTDYATLPIFTHRYMVLQAGQILLSRRQEDTSRIEKQLELWAAVIRKDLAQGRRTGHPTSPRVVYPTRYGRRRGRRVLAT